MSDVKPIYIVKDPLGLRLRCWTNVDSCRNIFVEPQTFNIVQVPGANIYLPECPEFMTEVRFLFVEEGEFNIIADCDLSFGIRFKSPHMIWEIGNMPISNQPRFFYILKKKTWFVIADGNAIIANDPMPYKRASTSE
jgi:hypothetical protein